MNYKTIKQLDIANGTGCRTSIFFCGCTHHCPGCFNSEIWDFNSGEKFDENVKNHLFDLLSLRFIKGLSVLGGEPLQQGEELTILLKEVKEKFPDKDIWLWTGYDMDELNEQQKQTISYCDYIVTGRFIKEKHQHNLKFRGSTNQYIWKKSDDGFYIIEG